MKFITKTLLLVGIFFFVTPNISAYAKVNAYTYRVVNTFPHDQNAFTQGLIFSDGQLFESTGLNGRSSIRKVKLETGKVLMQKAIDARYFGEGITIWNKQIIGLTWQTQTGFVWDKAGFKHIKSFKFQGEGWGLTHNKQHLILSNGTSTLTYLDPISYRPVKSIKVTLEGKPIDNLNELEWINGYIYANVWQTDYIVRIDPSNGQIDAVIDLSGLMKTISGKKQADAVLNGIAYDAAKNRFFVTGKLWPNLFEIVLVNKSDASLLSFTN